MFRNYDLDNKSSEYLQKLVEVDVKDGYLLFDIAPSEIPVYKWQFISQFGSLGIHGTKGEFRARDKISASIFEGSGTLTQIAMKGNDSLPQLNIAKLGAGTQFSGQIEKSLNISEDLANIVRIFTLNAPNLIGEFANNKSLSSIDRNGLTNINLEKDLSDSDPIDISSIASIGTLLSDPIDTIEKDFTLTSVAGLSQDVSLDGDITESGITSASAFFLNTFEQRYATVAESIPPLNPKTTPLDFFCET